jgi:ketosteroid isomerase-like protein
MFMSANDDLESFYEEFSSALETRDLNRLCQLYTDEAMFLASGTAPVIGNRQISDLFDGPSPAKKTTFEVGEILEDGDLIVDIGWILNDGSRVSRFIGVYRRQSDGRLKMAVDVLMKS